ncbi:hypothetical protein GCM10027612_35540 [Microbispora bryophytorum subsp. camponoti]
MSRVSQAEAKLNRERVVAAASRLFREDGVVKVGIADVMQSIGLTQGGFYKQFASKDALVDEAAAKAFADNLQDLVALDHEAGGIRRRGSRCSSPTSPSSIATTLALVVPQPVSRATLRVSPSTGRPTPGASRNSRGGSRLVTPAWPPMPRSSAAYFLPVPPQARLCRSRSCRRHMRRWRGLPTVVNRKPADV